MKTIQNILEIAMLESDKSDFQYLKSSIASELRWKYLQKKLRLPLLIGIVIWSAWMWQTVNALAFLQTRPIITL